MANEVGVRSIPDLKQFGNDLKKLSEQLQVVFHSTEHKMHHVCEGWNDNLNQKFMNEFQKDVKSIDKIASNMLEYANFISKTVEILERYQSTRL